MKYTVAICGTFNVENYGDVMFPVIFEKAMQKRGMEVELFRFSPGAHDEDSLAPGAVVYGVDEMEAVFEEHPFDAVVIGGGALIHYNDIAVKQGKSDAFSDYAMVDSWYTPIAFAVRHGVKVLFNLPQVPYAFDDTVKAVTAAALSAVEYLSFRDHTSREFAKEVFESGAEPPMTVAPDSVCAMAKLIDAEELAVLRQPLLPFDGKCAVVQFNRQKPPSEDAALLRVMERLSEKGLSVVLLPLGYTHDDDTILREFIRNYSAPCVMVDKKLNIFEMAAILAGCELYIGASFHGAITAMVYGKTAISYNYIQPRTKNREVFAMYGVSAFVGESADEVRDILERYWDGSLPFGADTASVIAQVDRHFDTLCEAIRSERRATPSYAELSEPLFKLLPRIVADEREMGRMADEISMKATHIANLEAILQNEGETLRAEIESWRQRYAAKDAECQTALFDFQQIQRSFFWRLTSPMRKLSQKLKNFLSRHRGLLKIAVFTKGFLRGGIKGGKARVAALPRPMVMNTKLTLEIPEKLRREQEAHVFEKDICFSILVPLYNTPMDFLEQMIRSVELQTYGKWELCLADGSDEEHGYVREYCLKKASKDARIKYQKLTENKGISENTNACIEMATGNYIALFDHDDVLEPTVLFEYMERICAEDADFLYCDEDKFHEFGGELYDAHFKPDFAVDNLRSNNYICHFTVFKASLLEKSGVFRKEFDGSQDHDMILRLTEQAQHIVHIPKVLYHWRVSAASVASDPYAKPYTIEAGRRAVREHLERVGLKGTVESTVIHPNIYRVKYDIVGEPLVSIIIPNYNHVDELSRCIDSILEKSTYKNYEIIIVENNSDEETFTYYETLKAHENIKVVVYKPPAGFNYSAINNFGVQFAKGEHYILLNNDVEIISPSWIEEMLMYSQREDVGAVGAMLYYPDDTIQHAGVTLGVLTLAGHNFKHQSRGTPGYFGRAGYQQNVTAVTAACLMLSAAVYKEIDGLDESFEVAFNDIDMCMRIRKTGRLLVFTPFAELYHYESISRGTDESPKKRARFVSEVTRFQERWKEELAAGDPFYNPNLTLEREDFSYR